MSNGDSHSYAGSTVRDTDGDSSSPTNTYLSGSTLWTDHRSVDTIDSYSIPGSSRLRRSRREILQSSNVDPFGTDTPTTPHLPTPWQSRKDREVKAIILEEIEYKFRNHLYHVPPDRQRFSHRYDDFSPIQRDLAIRKGIIGALLREKYLPGEASDRIDVPMLPVHIVTRLIRQDIREVDRAIKSQGLIPAGQPVLRPDFMIIEDHRDS